MPGRIFRLNFRIPVVSSICLNTSAWSVQTPEEAQEATMGSSSILLVQDDLAPGELFPAQNSPEVCDRDSGAFQRVGASGVKINI